MMNSPPKRRNLAQSVADDLDARIRQSVLKTGDKLPTESAIMEQYGVSRTVVREAISYLQAAGLVQTRHGIGTFVLEPPQAGLAIGAESIATLRDVLAILELRISMETEAAWLAASRRTDAQLAGLKDALTDMRRAQAAGQTSVEADVRFHRLIAEATANRYFVEMLGQLGNALIPRARLDVPALEQERPADYFERLDGEHTAIFDAIARQDPEAARMAMRTHLSSSRERLREAEQRSEAALG
jgi:DNA-binding FadR family transcriptional regulator